MGNVKFRPSNLHTLCLLKMDLKFLEVSLKWLETIDVDINYIQRKIFMYSALFELHDAVGLSDIFFL
jgi:hypothetical protein